MVLGRWHEKLRPVQTVIGCLACVCLVLSVFPLRAEGRADRHAVFAQTGWFAEVDQLLTAAGHSPSHAKLAASWAAPESWGAAGAGCSALRALLEHVDGGQLLALEELEEGAAAGRDVGHPVRDAELVERGQRVAAPRDREGGAVGDGLREGPGAGLEGAHLGSAPLDGAHREVHGVLSVTGHVGHGTHTGHLGGAALAQGLEEAHVALGFAAVALLAAAQPLGEAVAGVLHRHCGHLLHPGRVIRGRCRRGGLDGVVCCTISCASHQDCGEQCQAGESEAGNPHASCHSATAASGAASGAGVSMEPWS